MSIFVVCYNIVFWSLGAAHSLSWDYQPGVPQGQAAEVRVGWKEKPLGSLVARYILHQSAPNPLPATNATTTEVDEEQSTPEKDKSPSAEGATQVDVVSEPTYQEEVSSPNSDLDVQLARTTSCLSATASPAQHRRTSLSPSVAANVSPVPPADPPIRPPSTHSFDIQSIAHRSETLHTPKSLQIVVRVIRPLRALVSPSTCALAVALPIALIRPLKALFVDISASGGPNFKAPNGFPPLEFIIDTGMFVDLTPSYLV